MKGKPVTEAQCGQIGMFAAAGLPYKNIAESVGVSKATVCGIVRRLGLARHSTEPLPPETVAKIVERLRRGQGTPRISKALGIQQHRVEKIRRECKLKKRAGENGCRYDEQMKKIIRRKFRTFESRIAREFGVSPGWVRRFLRRRKMNEPDITVKLVQRVCKLCFPGGKLPPFDDSSGRLFVAAILAATPGLDSEPEPVVSAFSARVTEAVDCIRRQQSAQFLN